MSPAPTSTVQRTAFRVIAVLLSLAVAEAVVLAWMFFRAGPMLPTLQTGDHLLVNKPAAVAEPAPRKQVDVPVLDLNWVKGSYPKVDFTKIYPGWSSADIDLVQRESFSVRYVYEPFVQFRPLAMKKRFVEVTEAGYRAGAAPQPWPPDPNDYVVFVIGGSTTFSYGLPDDQTVVAQIQKEWSRRRPDLRLQVYNFGSGFYFSTQERILLEQFFLSRIVPNAIIFIDGVNDFAFADGRPQLTSTLHRAVSPDIPYAASTAPQTEAETAELVDAVLARYQRNVQLISSAALPHGVKLAFVGQPSPFLEYPRDDRTYPFEKPFVGHELAAAGYARFKELADDGAFGPYFIWCGDCFAAAQSSMYADGIHYSLAGAEVLARAILDRAEARGLLP